MLETIFSTANNWRRLDREVVRILSGIPCSPSVVAPEFARITYREEL